MSLEIKKHYKREYKRFYRDYKITPETKTKESQYSKKWNAKNLEKRKAIDAKSREKNREILRIRSRNWRLKNIDYARKMGRKRNKILKWQAVQYYGGKCKCCGVTELAWLTIEHEFKDGAKHRKELFGSVHSAGTKFYQWLKRNNYPKNLGLGVLCYNCNVASYWGICPHKEKLKK